MDADNAARQRFQSFKMGGGAPPQSLQSFSVHAHRRSRSRNSISSFPLSTPAPTIPLPPTPDASLSLPPKRPSSYHHHRRSSVSTRCESAELMGVSLPELPSAHSDDNINLGDKDSIRRRALWALEGKPDLAFSKVEIPDISSPDVSKPFEFPTKPSFPPGSGMNGNSSFVGKRDSFGKMFGSSSGSKDQLGTLLEEEEEEEEQQLDSTLPIEENKEVPQVVMDTKIVPRHRPAGLNLRPLSLVQGTVVCSASGNLPTPILTPTDTRKHGSFDAGAAHFNSIIHNSSFRVPSTRFSSSFGVNAFGSCDLGNKRRSSISYKRSADSIPRDMFPLPTPESTPTERRFPDQDHVQKPLSVADQHFLFRSHHILLSRITELERNLKSCASQSRHLSLTSELSTASSEPNDEMLQLISDLKAERDELKRDVDGWRQRVADADKQASMLAKRIEAERREAWVARSRLGLLEVERSGIEKTLETKTSALSQSIAENAVLIHERDELKSETKKLNARLKDADAAVDECARLRAALEQERARRKELEKLLDDVGLLNTPKLPHVTDGSCRRSPFPSKFSIRPRGLGFQSVDSEGSTTDVESVDDSFTKTECTLDSVAEEAELSDEDNGLAGYEDEEESDVSFNSPDSSSIGSADELNAKPSTRAAVETLQIPPLPSQPTNESRATLSKTWTFPRGQTTTSVKHHDEVDRFFGCLDDISGSPPRSEEMNQTTFLSASRFTSDDELPPFVIPSDVGVVVESASTRSLDVVPEEDEGDAVAGPEHDELVGEAVEGGVRFTFNTPPIIRVTPPFDPCATPPPEIRITPPVEACTTTPAVRPHVEESVSAKPESIPEPIEEDEDESSLTFVFPPKANSRPVERVTSPSRSSPPSRPGSGSASPPSSIPRAVSLRSMSPKAPSIMFTPSKNASGRFTAASSYSTPSGKKTPSSIPHPATTPKFYSIPAKVQALAVSSKQSQTGQNGSTFKPHSKNLMTNAPISAFRCFDSAQNGDVTSKVNGSSNSDPLPSAGEYFHAQDSSSLPSIMSNPLAARLPFQKLSHFIPFSWTPGAAAVASYLVPSSSGPGVSTTNSANSLPGVESNATHPGQRKFVSKARQLEKLRSRLGFERKDGMMHCSVVSACKGCSAAEVYL